MTRDSLATLWSLGSTFKALGSRTWPRTHVKYTWRLACSSSCVSFKRGDQSDSVAAPSCSSHRLSSYYLPSIAKEYGSCSRMDSSKFWRTRNTFYVPDPRRGTWHVLSGPLCRSVYIFIWTPSLARTEHWRRSSIIQTRTFQIESHL
ncbi:hypothetical protein BDZ89DRAFT_516350 [Hymenopellis radicata]|nr:hypothetical protein BDZ89DRAFT_516350 [Hymenopellis radicata]